MIKFIKKGVICLAVFSLTVISSSSAFGAINSVHRGITYRSYGDSVLSITGDGIVKNKTITVRELEKMEKGWFEGTYTMQTLVEPHHGKYKGISMEYLLRDLVGIKNSAKKVKILCSDGVSMEFTLEDMLKKDYINSKDSSKLPVILAFEREGYPLVPSTRDKGFVSQAGNDGGPLRLMVGQTVKGERNSTKCLKNVIEIIVSNDERKGSFSDIGQFYSWAKEAIDSLAEEKIMTGVGGDKFAPEKTLTRAEISTMLTKALKLQTNNSYKGSFKDVKEKDWFALFVDAASRNKLVTGYPDGTFKPQQEVNRQELIVMVVNAMGLQNEAKNSTGNKITFKDKNKIPSWAIGSVEIAEQKGLLSNIAVGYFSGSKTVNRAEAAVIIYRMLNDKNK